MSMTCPRRIEDFGPWKREENLDEWRKDNTCSFCGSMNPDEFMAKSKEGAELGPTDKSYKVYVGSTSKFYFKHLSIEQRKEFVQLMNSGVLNIGYPGHFYVLPFFCTREKREDDND